MGTLSRRTFLKCVGAAGAASLLPCMSIASVRPEASLILFNGKIVTLDKGDALAQAIALKGERILALGPTAEILAYAGPQTTRIDLQGKTVTPGLIDSHAHLPPFGNRELNWVNLQGLESKAEILERLAARARQTPKGQFINAWGVESTELSYLNRDDLDQVTTEHPLLAVHTTGQWGFANSPALALGGVDAATTSPPGSWVEKGLNGKPTGLLVHYPALYLVRRAIPKPTEGKIREAIRHAASLYCREGVTTVHDNFVMLTGMSANDEFSGLYLDMAAAGQLPVRLKIWPYLPTLADVREGVSELFTARQPNPASPFAELAAFKRQSPEGFARLWGGMKIAIDGSGPTAGWYRNRQALMLHEPAELEEMVGIIHRASQQVSVHAVGNMAVDTMLTVFESVQKQHPRPDPRHRIEHAMMPSETAFKRLRKTGIVISTHPQFIYPWGQQWNAQTRHQFIPLRTYLDHDIPVALGADPPAFSLWQPQYALWQAVARVTRQGTSLGSREAITIRQALRLQTLGSAYAAFQERETGSLEPGKLADLVVWDRDFLTVKPEAIREAKALTTIVGGKIVFSRETPAA